MSRSRWPPPRGDTDGPIDATMLSPARREIDHPHDAGLGRHVGRQLDCGLRPVHVVWSESDRGQPHQPIGPLKRSPERVGVVERPLHHLQSKFHEIVDLVRRPVNTNNLMTRSKQVLGHGATDVSVGCIDDETH